MSQHTRNDLVRVLFRLEPDSWHGSVTERLWAESVGHGRYRLRNTPFFAFGISNGDVVFGKEDDGQIVFSGISIRGGHSSYRIKLPSTIDRNEFLRFWGPIEALGCTYEEGDVVAVDVPPSADIYAVYRLLEDGASAGIWDFEEGHCAHPLQ
jgi:hypothetical protein